MIEEELGVCRRLKTILSGSFKDTERAQREF